MLRVISHPWLALFLSVGLPGPFLQVCQTTFIQISEIALLRVVQNNMPKRGSVQEWGTNGSFPKIKIVSQNKKERPHQAASTTVNRELKFYTTQCIIKC